MNRLEYIVLELMREYSKGNIIFSIKMKCCFRKRSYLMELR